MEEDDVEDFPATQEDPNSHFTTIAHESEPPATQQDADADDNHGEEADDTGPAHRMPAESLKRPLDTSGTGASSQPLSDSSTTSMRARLRRGIGLPAHVTGSHGR